MLLQKQQCIRVLKERFLRTRSVSSGIERLDGDIFVMVEEETECPWPGVRAAKT